MYRRNRKLSGRGKGGASLHWGACIVAFLVLAPLTGACNRGPTGGENIGQIVERSVVAERETGGYEAYRIPVLVRSPNGDLLLFSEARRTERDFGDIDVLLFRSRDGGDTWSEGTVVADNEEGTASDIAALVEGDRIHLFYQFRPGERTFDDYLKKGAADARGYHTYSDDNGRTWSEPVDITDQVLPEPDKQLPMFGPNNGLRLDSGRLIVPMYYADQATETWTPAVIYSDDGGQTWHRSADAVTEEEANETAVVQVQNGDLYGIGRDGRDDDSPRKHFFRSTDRGETWEESGEVDDFITEIYCQQSMVSDGNRIFFASPLKKGRRDGRLRTGVYDLNQKDNIDWSSNEIQITPDGFAYSSMTIDGSTLNIVYEETDPHAKNYMYKSLEYVRIDLTKKKCSKMETKNYDIVYCIVM